MSTQPIEQGHTADDLAELLARATAAAPAAPDVAQLGQQVEELKALVASLVPAAAPFTTPEPLIVERKAAGWQPCPVCESPDADVYKDGTARCEDCGMLLKPAADAPKQLEADLELKAVKVQAAGVYEELGEALRDAGLLVDDA